MTNGTTQQKIVKISVISYPDSPQDFLESENLLPFATAIVEHWQPIQTWTQAALILSQNGVYLITITISIVAFLIAFYLVEKIKQRKANAKAYQKLSEPNKQIIDAILETQKTTTPTLSAIAATYNRRTEKAIKKEEMFYMLLEVEKTGIIKSYIASNQDAPTQAWKAQMFS
jgi:hypothetical protein